MKTDVVLVGAGIMSATLGALLRRLEPGWSMTFVERLDAAARESSDPWHNAGTGHSALCELNYTPERHGLIDTGKAVRINEEFQLSRQFWAYAVESGILTDVRSFLRAIPHASFARGADGVAFLRRRRQALAANPLFNRTELIVDADEFARRLPLMAAQRVCTEPIGLNWAADGTDVDFGALTTKLIDFCVRGGASAMFGHEVRGLSRESDRGWTCEVRDRRSGRTRTLHARFVFVGAGGNTLPLLQKSGIAEARGFGGFPIGGRFLRTADPTLVAAHRAKVYGVPAPGAPPLGARHLDLRVIDGRPWLVFGPFAGWSPKFLKQGRLSDLPRSVKPNNVRPMLGVGASQKAMLAYLLGQLRLSQRDRLVALREFVPAAVDAQWETVAAGQRVQVIRPAPRGGGVLDFDTTVLSSADGSLAGLLGASPGASTAVAAMLEVLRRCFPSRYQMWLPTLKEMVPSLGAQLSREPALFDELRAWTTKVLELDADGGAA